MDVIRIKKGDMAAVVSIILLYVLMGIIGITCPIRFVTGISCAGCGMTRAWIALLHLRFHDAFSYHPLCLLPVPVLFWILLRKRIPPRLWMAVMGLVAAVFLIVYALRLANPADTVVTADLSEGLVCRIWRFIYDSRIFTH